MQHASVIVIRAWGGSCGCGGLRAEAHDCGSCVVQLRAERLQILDLAIKRQDHWAMGVRALVSAPSSREHKLVQRRRITYDRNALGDPVRAEQF